MAPIVSDGDELAAHPPEACSEAHSFGPYQVYLTPVQRHRGRPSLTRRRDRGRLAAAFVVSEVRGSRPVAVPIETSLTIGRPREPPCSLVGRRERACSTLAVMCAYEDARYAQTDRRIVLVIARSLARRYRARSALDFAGYVCLESGSPRDVGAPS